FTPSSSANWSGFTPGSRLRFWATITAYRRARAAAGDAETATTGRAINSASASCFTGRSRPAGWPARRRSARAGAPAPRFRLDRRWPGQVPLDPEARVETDEEQRAVAAAVAGRELQHRLAAAARDLGSRVERGDAVGRDAERADPHRPGHLDAAAGLEGLRRR